MKTYSITISDEMFGQFTGEFEAETKAQAIKDAKEFYACEMDCNPENIEIISIN